jgi:hypothetical protein
LSPGAIETYSRARPRCGRRRKHSCSASMRLTTCLHGAALPTMSKYLVRCCPSRTDRFYVERFQGPKLSWSLTMNTHLGPACLSQACWRQQMLALLSGRARLQCLTDAVLCRRAWIRRYQDCGLVRQCGTILGSGHTKRSDSCGSHWCPWRWMGNTEGSVSYAADEARL